MVSKLTLLFLSLLLYSLITPLPSCPKPLFQSEAKYEAIDIKMSWTVILLQRLQITLIFTREALKVRVYGTRKWPVPERIKNSPTCNLDFKVRYAPAVVASRALQVISLAFLFIFFFDNDNWHTFINSAKFSCSTVKHLHPLHTYFLLSVAVSILLSFSNHVFNFVFT